MVGGEGIVQREQGTGWRPMAGEGLGQRVLKSEAVLAGTSVLSPFYSPVLPACQLTLPSWS